MARPKSDFTRLDAALLVIIAAGGNPYAATVGHVYQPPGRVYRRMQVLRKAGEIEYARATNTWRCTPEGTKA